MVHKPEVHSGCIASFDSLHSLDRKEADIVDNLVGSHFDFRTGCWGIAAGIDMVHWVHCYIGTKTVS